MLPDTDPEEVCDDSLFHHWFCSDTAIESDNFIYVRRKELASSALEWVKKLKSRLHGTLKLAESFQPAMKKYLKDGSQMMSQIQSKNSEIFQPSGTRASPDQFPNYLPEHTNSLAVHLENTQTLTFSLYKFPGHPFER